MANASEQSAVAARAGKPFTFTRTRGNAVTEFFPGAGSTLHFANRDTDLFTARGLPAGLLQAGDKVEVYYGATQSSQVRVFSGDVKTIVDRHGRGDERVQDVTVAGPWDKLNRLVFRQTWGAGNLEFSSSRVILGQTAAGLAQTMAAQLAEIAGFAATPCGIALGTNAAPAQYLPLDEARDITCADAIRRELRFFPKLVVRFDYTAATPALQIVDTSGDSAAAYVATIPKTDREYTYDAHPVKYVDVTVDAVEITVNGDTESFHQIYPEPPSGTTPSPLDILHVTVPLARGGGSTSSETFRIESEAIPSALNSVSWWKSKHPRLANVAAGAIRFASNPTRSPSNYGYIVKNAREEIEAAGKHCEVSQFTCKVKIETPDDIEDEITLTMDFLTTDARSGTYTVQTGSTATAGEELPDGLAQALYEQRSQSLASERMTVRLGATFPKLGDKLVETVGSSSETLYLQSFDVDLADLTARLSFGQPEHLSAEDMKSLLNGFRQRGSASTAVLREREGAAAADQPAAPGGIPPISSSEWSPGTKRKTTIWGEAQSGNRVVISTDALGTQVQVVDSYNRTISLDAHALSANEIMGVRTLSYTDGSGRQQAIKVLATESATIPPPGSGSGSGSGSGEGGSGSSGTQISLVTGVGTRWNPETRQTEVWVSRRNVHVLSVDDSQPTVDYYPLASAAVNLVTGVVPSFDANTKKLTLTTNRRQFRVVGTEDLNASPTQSTEDTAIPIQDPVTGKHINVVVGVTPSWDENGQMQLTIGRRNLTILDNTDTTANSTVKVPLHKTGLVAGVKYDASTHKLEQLRVDGVTSAAVSTGDLNGYTDAEVFEADPHAAEVS